MWPLIHLKDSYLFSLLKCAYISRLLLQIILLSFMLLNLCFVIVRRLFTCGCKLLWILSQSRPVGCIHTEVQALWSSCGRLQPKLRIVSGRLLLLGAAALSHEGTYVTSLQCCLKPLCCTLCGMKKRKVALSCELYSAQGPRLNNPSPCPAPLIHEKCL